MSADSEGRPAATAPQVVAVAFCPATPLLLPAVEGRAAAETTALRAACDAAVRRMLSAHPATVLVVGAPAPAGVRYGAGDAGDLRGFGVDLRLPFSGPERSDAARLPLPHALGAWLLDRAGFAGTRLGVAPGDLAAALAELTGRVAVLAMGEGSARRSVKAPGYLDESAGPFDAAVGTALATGDAAALASLDPDEGERLLAAGVPTWVAVGRALAGRPVTAHLRYDDAPFGVGYLVADWTAA